MTAFKTMTPGHCQPGQLIMPVPGSATPAQQLAIAQLQDDVRWFLSGEATPVPDLNWRQVFREARLDYTGELHVSKPPCHRQE